MTVSHFEACGRRNVSVALTSPYRRAKLPKKLTFAVRASPLEAGRRPSRKGSRVDFSPPPDRGCLLSRKVSRYRERMEAIPLAPGPGRTIHGPSRRAAAVRPAPGGGFPERAHVSVAHARLGAGGACGQVHPRFHSPKLPKSLQFLPYPLRKLPNCLRLVPVSTPKSTLSACQY